jgi:hypothetical protein
MTTAALTLSTDHAQSSYGIPVAIAQDGTVYGPADLGLLGMASNLCGRVDRYDAQPQHRLMANGNEDPVAKYLGVHWSGFGDNPYKMWDAVCSAFAAGARHIRVISCSRVETW